MRATAPRQPESEGKHATFWHSISEGESEEQRTPCLARCRRACWLGWLIRRVDSDPRISWWENTRQARGGQEPHIVILFEPERFVVVLARRLGATAASPYLVLRTAYVVDQEHRLRRMIEERDKWRALNRPP